MRRMGTRTLFELMALRCNITATKGEDRMKRLQLETTWIFTLAASLLLTTIAMAGDLDAPAPPSDPGSAMFTLEDLYNRLSYGTAGAKRSGAFTGPVATPGSTMRTLNEIMAKAPAPNGSAATAAEVLTGKTYWGLSSGSNWGARTGTMANVGAQSITPGTTPRTISQGYHDGTGTVAGDTNLMTTNIKSGVTIFGVGGNGNVVDTSSGTATAGSLLTGATAWVAGAEVTGIMANVGAQNITPSTTSQTISQGYHDGGGTVAGDANLTAGNIKSGATVFGVTGTFTTAIAKRVNKTGQTACWDSAGTSIPCAGTGQDGAYQYGIDPVVAPSWGTTGSYNSPVSTGTRFIDNNNGTVTDTLTALIWQKDSSCHGSKTWQGALVACNDLSAATSGCGLSDGSTAGQWRLPNVNELHSLGPVWPLAAPFLGNLSSYYWSSTTYADGVSGAWLVGFGDGNAGVNGKSVGDYVRCVRGGQ
jgi:hypothetical protein